ncbi:MAG: proline iminopeptidase-family hydrolase [Steroidobacteraceae bacterium]
MTCSRRTILRGLALAPALFHGYLPRCLADTEFFPEPEVSGFIPVRGGTIWYRVNGRRHFANGRTPLLALHGGPGSTHHYLLPLTDLADERPVILYDQLDCGLSERPGNAANWTTDRFVSEIDSIRQFLGLSRVALYGNSCGATWVAEYAVRQPQGLESIILASPFLSAARYRADAARLRALLPSDIRAALDLHEAQGTTDSDEYQNASLFWLERHVCRKLPWPDYIQRTIELFSNDLYHYMWGHSEADISGTLKDYDLTDRLDQISARTFYLCGEHDETTPQATRYFASRTPGARFQEFAGASHTPHIEKRDEFMAVCREFLRSA